MQRITLSDVGAFSLPETFEHLPALTHLSLVNYAHILPDSITTIKTLKHLDISKYKGSLPSNFGNFKNLEFLDFSNGGLSLVNFPESILELKELRTLHLKERLFKNVPQEITNLSKLNTLDISCSFNFVSRIPDLSKMKNLKKLYCSGKNGRGVGRYPGHHIYKGFFNILNLEVLDISSYDEHKVIESEEIWEKVRQGFKDDPTNLALFNSRCSIEDGKHIYYYRKNMTLADLEGIGNLKNLKELDLSDNDLTELPDEFFELKNLEKTNLSKNNFTSETLKKIKAFAEKQRSNSGMKLILV